jgi:hypothetical protein
LASRLACGRQMFTPLDHPDLQAEASADVRHG